MRRTVDCRVEASEAGCSVPMRGERDEVVRPSAGALPEQRGGTHDTGVGAQTVRG